MRERELKEGEGERAKRERVMSSHSSGRKNITDQRCGKYRDTEKKTK